ncbi:Na+-H+ antiporter family protein [Anaerosphaera aminiphila DSM 21120]|uniref:Na+-H+ antiporter family protein n=1 Tax=Anaerosphaera aminiphila DSM 21120 TaxID=1120995 RepID=A0A1M5UY04_9FIRM|nr:Na+-H+ antiporter family protein [Anaerosphaera aminiphila DSM 21120]
MILLNPVVISVLVLAILCLLKLPVFIALIVAALTAGLASGNYLSGTMLTFLMEWVEMQIQPLVTFY